MPTPSAHELDPKKLELVRQFVDAAHAHARRMEGAGHAPFPSPPAITHRVPVREVGRIGIGRSPAGLPLTEPTPDMAPYLARGLGSDPGEYARMVASDGTIAGILGLISREISRASWSIELPRDPTREEGNAGDLLAHYLGLDGREAWIYGGWPRHIRHALHALQFGFSAFEVTWDTRRHQGADVLSPSRIRWRAPQSVWGWLWRRDDLIALLQCVPQDFADAYAPPPSAISPDGMPWGGGSGTVPPSQSLRFGRARAVAIPVDRLLLYGYGETDGNPEAQSLLRPAWWAWRAKQDTVIRDQGAGERLFSGVTTLKELATKEDQPFPSSSAVDVETFEQMLNAFANGMINWMVAPIGYDLRTDYPGFNIPDPTKRLEYYDHQIRVTLAAQILGLGAKSENLADSLGQLFYNGIASIAGWIAEVFTGQPGLPWTGVTKRLIDANIPHDGAIRYPRLVARGIAFQDAKSFTDALTKGLQFRALTYRPALEDVLLSKLDMPPLSPAEYAARSRLAEARVEGDTQSALAAATPADVSAAPPDDPPPESREGEEGTQAPKEAPNQEPIQDPDGV